MAHVLFHLTLSVAHEECQYFRFWQSSFDSNSVARDSFSSLSLRDNRRHHAAILFVIRIHRREVSPVDSRDLSRVPGQRENIPTRFCCRLSLFLFVIHTFVDATLISRVVGLTIRKLSDTLRAQLHPSI